MKQNLTEIAFVIDRSGSMLELMSDAIGGFNQFVKDQKAGPGEAKLTLVIFDSEYKIVHDGIDIQEVPKLTSKVCFPRYNTALLDAVGKTINILGARLAATPEEDRPGQVIVVITTDGFENASQEFSSEQLQNMIAEQKEKYSWEFIFMAAGEDHVLHAGINVLGAKNFGDHNTVRCDATGAAYSGTMSFMSSTVTRYRAGHSVDLSSQGEENTGV